MKKIGIIGLGQVGSAIQKVEENAKNEVFVLDTCKDMNTLGDLFRNNLKTVLDVMHICMPYNEYFTEDAISYIRSYKTKLVIIHSTTDVGTTKEISDAVDTHVVHSFVRGIHPNLYEGIMAFTKYVGGDEESGNLAIEHLESVGIDPYYLGDSKTTELAKIISTTYYGWNIVFAKEVKKICDNYGLSYDKVYTQPNLTYNDGYTRLGHPNVCRPTLTPPPDAGIGGHCISDNAMTLHKNTKSKIAETVLDLGYKHKDKYKNDIWLYCEFVVKGRTNIDIAEECGVSVEKVNEHILDLDQNVR